MALLAALARGPANADDGQEAADFVRDFSDRALVMLSDETWSKRTGSRSSGRLLTSGFHLELIGRFVLGRHWRRASEAERAEFAQLFEDYLVASYAQKLGEYGGEQLVVQGGRPKGKSGAIVSSRILRPQGDRLSGRMAAAPRNGEGWRIIDVVVEGVSMAVTHRSEFSSVICQPRRRRWEGCWRRCAAKPRSRTPWLTAGSEESS